MQVYTHRRRRSMSGGWHALRQRCQVIPPASACFATIVKPCGISVQPVYASVYKRLVLTAIVVHERICKRVVMVSGGGMGRHIKRLCLLR